MKEEGCVHFPLLDPAKFDRDKAAKVARVAEKAGSCAFLVGGTLGVGARDVDEVVKGLRKGSSLPVILFPSNPACVTPSVDAVFFLSLLNSANPYYIAGAQATAALLIKRYGLEAIPVGYLIVGEGRSVGFVGEARPIPPDGFEIAEAYALACEYMGMEFVYLEAGSGAEETVPPKMVSRVSRSVRIPVIVGGGIRDPKTARTLSLAGAKGIVTGSLLEKKGFEKVLEDLVRAIRR